MVFCLFPPINVMFAPSLENSLGRSEENDGRQVILGPIVSFRF